jgi:predicted PurR-regulated permease PerM
MTAETAGPVPENIEGAARPPASGAAPAGPGGGSAARRAGQRIAVVTRRAGQRIGLARHALDDRTAREGAAKERQAAAKRRAEETARRAAAEIAAETQYADESAAREPVSPRTVYRWAVAASLGVLTVYLGYRALYAVITVVVQVLIAAFIAVSLDPAVRWMILRRVRRAHAVAIIFGVVIAGIVGFLIIFLPPLIHQGTSLSSDFPGYLDHLRSRSPSLRHLEDTFRLQPKIDSLARTLPGKIGKDALAFSQRFLGAVVSALLVVVLTIYFMVDLPRLRRGLVRLFPRRHRRPVNDAVNVVIDKVGSYMIGNLLVSLIAGVTACIALFALRIPFALPLAVFVAVTDLIPMIGATLGAAVCVIVAFATTDLWPNTALLAIFFLLYQQVENYVVVPKVMRDSVEMPAVAVLLAALFGGSVLGLVGALMAIPIAAAVKVIATPMMRARDDEDPGPDPGGPPGQATLDADARQ